MRGRLSGNELQIYLMYTMLVFMLNVTVGIYRSAAAICKNQPESLRISQPNTYRAFRSHRFCCSFSYVNISAGHLNVWYLGLNCSYYLKEAIKHTNEKSLGEYLSLTEDVEGLVSCPR